MRGDVVMGITGILNCSFPVNYLSSIVYMFTIYALSRVKLFRNFKEVDLSSVCYTWFYCTKMSFRSTYITKHFEIYTILFIAPGINIADLLKAGRM
jgi:hypothetical protein